MTTIRFVFSNETQLFGKADVGSNSFYVETATVPLNGEIVDFKLAEFISDPSIIKRFEEAREDRNLIAERIAVTYGKNTAEYLVSLELK